MEGYRDLSDASYQLAVLKKQREDTAAAKAETMKRGAKISANLWKMYSKDQAFSTARKLETEFEGQKMFEVNPEWADKGFIRRQFTPTAGRVQLTTEGQQVKDSAGIYEQGIKDNPWLTEGDDFFANTYDDAGNVTGKFTDYDVAGAGTEVGIKDITDASKYSEKAISATANKGPTTFKEYLGGGNKLGYLAAGVSAYDTLSNWSDRDSTEKAKSVIDTGLAVGSAMNPALLPFYLGYQLFK